MTQQMDYGRRQRALLQKMKAIELDGFLVTHMPNVRYLCGFTGSSGALAMAKGKRTFFTDGRYAQQGRDEIEQVRLVITKKPAISAAIEWLAAQGMAKIGFEGDQLSVTMHAKFRNILGSFRRRPRLTTTTSMVEAMRMVKEQQEIEQIRAAVVLASQVFASCLPTLKKGIRENDFAAELDYVARRLGAEGMAFPTLVASGSRSALPHGTPSTQTIAGKGFVMIDFGVILGGYCSDMTRTVHLGRPSERATKVYQAVLEAQLAAIAAVRPGSSCAAVDQAARKVLNKAKLARYFTHSTGHGVGLEIHESPRIGRGQDYVLQPGHVITIEPGLYIPGEGGVRIEDMVVVTESGCEVLTPTGKEMIVL